MKIKHDPGRADYARRRAAEYPNLAAQLDALWHAMEAGTLPKVPGFHDAIAAVKARYPKPEGDPDAPAP